MRLIGFVIACSLWFSCKQHPKIRYSLNNRKKELNDSFELVKRGEKIFFLDSSTVPTSKSIFYNNVDGKNYLTIYNAPSNSICVFNDSGKVAFKIQLEKNGPNGVGKVEGYYLHNLDSIFIFDQWNKRISLINRNGEIRNTFSFPRFWDKKSYLPAIMASTVNPWIYLDGKLFGTGFKLGEMDDENAYNRPVVISFDLDSRLATYFVSYPDIYQRANWGGYNYRMIYSTFDDSSNLILSFPADHNIYKVNLLNKHVKSYYAGSKYVDTIPSLGKTKHYRNKWFMNRYFGSNSSYSSIIYDRFRNLYYRIVDLPIKDYHENIKEKSVKPFSVVILNSKMERLGETSIPQLSHSRIAFYISKEGLNLRKYDEDEDHLTFTVYGITSSMSSFASNKK